MGGGEGRARALTTAPLGGGAGALAQEPYGGKACRQRHRGGKGMRTVGWGPGGGGASNGRPCAPPPKPTAAGRGAPAASYAAAPCAGAVCVPWRAPRCSNGQHRVPVCLGVRGERESGRRQPVGRAGVLARCAAQWQCIFAGWVRRRAANGAAPGGRATVPRPLRGGRRNRRSADRAHRRGSCAATAARCRRRCRRHRRAAAAARRAPPAAARSPPARPRAGGGG
jgi:hypothetical protein